MHPNGALPPQKDRPINLVKDYQDGSLKPRTFFAGAAFNISPPLYGARTPQKARTPDLLKDCGFRWDIREHRVAHCNMACVSARLCQGRTENTVIVDCLEAGREPKLDDMMGGYVANSRTREMENLLIMQPFSPALFNQGPPPGPTILMSLLRGEISSDDVDEEFGRLRREASDGGVEKNLMKMRWPCRACQVAGREDFMKPMADFGVRRPADFINRLLEQGHWTRCAQCSRVRKGQLGECGGQLGGMNDTVLERQRAASQKLYTCKTCSADLPRSHFWPTDVENFGPSKQIACKVCNPTPPHEHQQKIK